MKIFWLLIIALQLAGCGRNDNREYEVTYVVDEDFLGLASLDIITCNNRSDVSKVDIQANGTGIICEYVANSWQSISVEYRESRAAIPFVDYFTDDVLPLALAYYPLSVPGKQLIYVGQFPVPAKSEQTFKRYGYRALNLSSLIGGEGSVLEK